MTMSNMRKEDAMRFGKTFVPVREFVLAATLLGTVCSAAVSGETTPPTFQDPDLSEILMRIAPQFDSPAGSPNPSFTRGIPPDNDGRFLVGKPEMVMPTGAGTLSAMVCYGDSLELHLSKTGYYSIAPPGGDNTWPSLGHFSIRFDKASATELTKFRQRLDLLRGSVCIDIETAEGKIGVEVAGDMRRDCLVVSVKDSRPKVGPTRIHYENTRESVRVSVADSLLSIVESYPKPQSDWRAGKAHSLAMRAGLRGGASFSKAEAGGGREGAITVEKGGSFELIIAAVSRVDTPPEAEVKMAWDAEATLSQQEIEKERLAWWREFWSHSWIDLRGGQGEYFSRLWYVTLYSYACVGQGPVPPKFNGGPGLVYKDERKWGDGFWWQNQREIIWPMNVAGHSELSRRHFDFLNRFFEQSIEKAKSWGMDGSCFGEWVTIAYVKGDLGERGPAVLQAPRYVSGAVSPQKAFETRSDEKHRNGGYTSHIFSGGAVLTQLLFEHVQHTGDAAFLHDIAAPWLKTVVANAISLLSLEEDGRFHVKFADANEQWWRVDDASSLVAAIRYALAMTARYGDELGFEKQLVTDAADRLAKLTPLPTAASWSYAGGNGLEKLLGKFEDGSRVFAPFRLVAETVAHNTENPELYAVFPFAFSDLNSSPQLLEIGRETFKRRVFPNSAAWSQCPVQAARLGLPDTAAIIGDHAARHQKWPYGGWNSPGTPLYSKGPVSDCPYFDGAGVNMTALQEALLQSHFPAEAYGGLFEGGPIRLLPAVPPEWSGSFLLHARGGVSVRVQLAEGKLKSALFEATRATRVKVVNTFGACRLWRDGRPEPEQSGPMIEFSAAPGERVIMAAVAK